GCHQHQPGHPDRQSHPRSRAALAAQRHVGLLAADRLQHPSQERLHRRVGGQAELLRHHRLGRPGRELLALPEQGPSGGHRRAPRVARVDGAGRRQAPERRSRRRCRPVPRRPRRGCGRRWRARLHAAQRRPRRRPRLPAGNRRRELAGQRRHPVL
ncbi:MAG: Single-stranded DNA-binding protein, partial [uncultured Solirubrobacteraceae bacterium]